MLSPDIIQKGDRVRLATNNQWYAVHKPSYRQHLGFTCLPDCHPIYGEYLFIGRQDDGNRSELQVIAVAEVWRGSRLVYSEDIMQLDLFPEETP